METKTVAIDKDEIEKDRGRRRDLILFTCPYCGRTRGFFAFGGVFNSLFDEGEVEYDCHNFLAEFAGTEEDNSTRCFRRIMLKKMQSDFAAEFAENLAYEVINNKILGLKPKALKGWQRLRDHKGILEVWSHKHASGEAKGRWFFECPFCDKHIEDTGFTNHSCVEHLYKIIRGYSGRG